MSNDCFKPSISIVMNTCRDDYPLMGNPETFIFEPTVFSLNKQFEQNFELVIVDACWSEKREKWIDDNTEFPHKYLNALPNRFLEKGMVAIASMKNKGLIHADGELIFFMDDCTEFPPWHTKKAWEIYLGGNWPLSLTVYMEDGKECEAKDDRRKFFINTPKFRPNWYHYWGGSSVPRDVIYMLNGIDERFDGKKSLEDSSLGSRLQMVGYLKQLLLDVDFYHFEHKHNPVSTKVLTYNGPAPACNHALLLHNRIRQNYRVNKELLTREECLWIRNNICPKNCAVYPKCLNESFRGLFYVEGEGFETWLSLQKTIDLKEERSKRSP